MNFKTVVCIFICTLSIHEVLPVTIQVNTLTTQTGTTKSSDATKITFFGDRHVMSPVDQEQTTSVLAFLQQEKNSLYHILVEQAAKFHKAVLPENRFNASDYRLLHTLDKRIQAVQPSMTHVVLDNIEVRHFSGLAMSILNCYKYYEPYQQCEIDDSKKMLGSITFQDIFDEFDALQESLDPYYVNQKNQTVSAIYADYMAVAHEYCEQLKRKIVRKNEIVFDYAKKEYRQREAQEMKSSQVAQDLAKDIELTFNHLFDLNLLKNILMSNSPNICVFAGRDHTRVVMSMFVRLNAIKLYQAINFVMQEKIEKNGQKTQQLTLQPITGKQILQALSAQQAIPQQLITGSSSQMFFASALMSTVMYLLYTKYNATDEEEVQEGDCLDADVVEDSSKVECPNEAVA